VLRTRLIVGTVLAIGIGIVLYLDRTNAPKYPGLMLVAFGLGSLATREFLALLPSDTRPRSDLTWFAVLSLIAMNWPHVFLVPVAGSGDLRGLDAKSAVIGMFVAVVLMAFLLEIANYRGPGGNVARVANVVLVTVYLGLLPSCLIQLRWLPDDRSGVALLLAIFVPKCCDIGAYFTGRIFGWHQFSPLLSPKKTWEGFAGGMLFAVGTAVGLSFAAPVFRYGIPEAVMFGLAVGLAGVFGDLAESMIKRDAMAKDASASVPGFGGVLDVIDSVIFAAPVAYLFLVW
jgi:phosphatidate cytidylyltransferase